MSIQIVKVPDIGGDDVEVIEICVKVGDQIAEEDSLVVLESDKASMEVPSPYAGIVKSITMAVGDHVAEGAVILELEQEQNTAAAAEPEPQAVITAPVAVPETQPVLPVEAVNAAPATQSTVSSVENINVPDFGGGEADVIEICVAVGDEISEGDSIIVLETDKASMEVPSPKSGKVMAIHIKDGSKASEGIAILDLAVQAAVATETVLETQPEITPVVIPELPLAKKDLNTTPAVQRVSGKDFVGDALYAGPAVRKILREFGVDGGLVQGSGPKGRILKEDVQEFVKNALANKSTALTGGSGIPPIPEVDFSQFGEVDIQALSKIAKVTAANMQRSWLNVPHVTQFDDADITELEDFRNSLKAEAEKRGVKITPLPFLLKACANALRANPIFNSSLDASGENLVYKNYVHIGIAVDTPVGLMVPVIRDVDKKSIWELAAETAEVADKAKNRKLKPTDMQGGCFTISSLGGIGGTGFTPIVNAPEVGILGVSKLAVKPVWNGSEFVPRKMLPLAVSYDHRVVNGGDAGRFFTYLTGLLADIRRMVL